MKTLLIILLLAFLSCQSIQDSKEKSSVPSEQSNVQLPSFVAEMLKSDLIGWRLASKSSWQDSSFRKYQTDSSQINYFIRDFNCDGKQDFAGILEDSAGNYATFKIYSLGQYYTYTQLENFGKQSLLNIGLRFIDPTESFRHFGGSSQTFKCGAIERFNITNIGKKLFYGNEKGFFVIEVGD
jgi:hypothetical protein